MHTPSLFSSTETAAIGVVYHGAREVYKWKNHFYEMKGGVGISLHEKEKNKMPTPRHKATHNPIPTSLFCFNMLCLFVRQSKQHNILTHELKCVLWSWKKQRCRDGVMSGFVSWCRHLVPFFFMK